MTVMFQKVSSASTWRRRKELWKTLLPPDAAGVYFIGPVGVTRDCQSWAYSVNRIIFSELWQVTGLAVR